MNLKVADAKREEGFTLIELLVVVIIIGILAAIAIPIFLNQRQRAWIGSTESDVRNAAIEIETQGTRAGNYPLPGAVDTTGVVTSQGVTVLYNTIDEAGNATAVADDAISFHLCGQHVNLEDRSITYDASSGGLLDEWDEANFCAASGDFEGTGAVDLDP